MAKRKLYPDECVAFEVINAHLAWSGRQSEAWPTADPSCVEDYPIEMPSPRGISAGVLRVDEVCPLTPTAKALLDVLPLVYCDEKGNPL